MLASLLLVSAVTTASAVPDVPLRTLAGTPTTLRAAVRTGVGRKRTVLVNFWASWCGPCRDELPVLLRAQREGRVDVLAVNVGESAATVRRFLDREGLGGLHVMLARPADAAVLGLPGLPASLVLKGAGLRKVFGPLRDDQIGALTRVR
ncbi:TlpA family protein disulfide reductase [Deinococcus pimensis]|uniref:TlpA family protein disulfide reductase n=1 Tax=Deinococcus pimensis TaxID=309888 RepID=UPI0004BA26EF|nr:TlpA disulfide reductase family protein [Deinococcus pimensis]